MKLIAALLFVFFSIEAMTQDITPVPVQFVRGTGKGISISNSTLILYDGAFIKQASYLGEQVQKQCGITMVSAPLSAYKSSGHIRLVFDSVNITHPEMYKLAISNDEATISAKTVRGIVNGIQTLLQLLPLTKTSTYNLQPATYLDFPRFAYRGMHLDVVRHFFPLDYIKKYIDYLSFHKFNTFHWHLTDDQGWRIEVLSYPRLNSIGSWRDSTLIGHFKDTPAKYEKKRYGGYYTRAEVKEILEYAAVRGITVIPEIDIPGHSRATITAYPELSTDPANKWGVAYTWGMYNRQNNVLAPTPETFEFLRTIFHEIADLFPSEYIHIGGDECSKMWWKQSASTQAFMKTKGLKDEVALQSYFIEQVAGYLKEKNKKVIGWHEIMEGKIDTSSILMNWADDKKAIEAVGRGFSVIMTPGKPYYFDHYQSKDLSKDSLAIHGYNPLEAVYKYEPVPAAISSKGLAHKILGGQANVWTEYMEYPTKVDYMVLPRMTAVGESLWSPPEKKDYKDFIRRLNSFILPRYETWGSSWFRGFEEWDMSK
jgi:hexosaminidase